MSYRHDATGLFLTALLGALATVGASAQTATALLEVLIDGRTSGPVLAFEMRHGEPHATLATWRGSGVRVPAGFGQNEAPEALHSVATLTGITARLDGATQTLHLAVQPDLSGLSLIGRPDAGPPAELPRDSGAVINYDAIVQQSGGTARRSALIDSWVFGPLGVLEHSAIVAGPAKPRYLRLNTTFTRVEPARMRRWRGGDFISGGLSWSRPVRLVGVQLMKDFGLRPDLVTTPTPELGGQVSVPSTIDVLVNGVRQLSQPVEPGRFELRQLPLVSGAGEVAVVVRDALGRETVQSLPFYASPRQLAAGLTEFSLEAGRVRRNFGIASNEHGPVAALGTLRVGLTGALTLEAHAERTQGNSAAGASGVWLLPALGMLSAQAATSGGAGHHGTQFGLAAEHQSQRGHAALAYTRASPGYRDTAATQAEPVPLGNLRLSAGLNFGRAGNLGAAWLDLKTPATPSLTGPLLPARRQRLASGTYSVALAPSVHALVSAFRSTRGSEKSHGLSLHLSMPLGGQGSASGSYTRDPRGASLLAQAHRPAVEVEELGWRVMAERGVAGTAADRQQADLEYRAPTAHLWAAAEHLGHASATRLGAQGSLIVLAGGVHAAPPASRSVALVDLADTPGVAVYRENRLVGRTDRRGHLVVPDLLPYQANRISIDPLDMPLDTDFAVLTQEVRPVERAAVVVRYGIERRRSALVALVDAQGRALPLGAQAMVAQGNRFPVGHDGLAYLRDLADDNELAVSWAGGARQCRARFVLADIDRQTGRIGPVSCR